MGRAKKIFWPKPSWWVKKNSIQPNSTHHINQIQLTWIELGQIEFDKIFFIIIKVEKNININILKKT